MKNLLSRVALLVALSLLYEGCDVNSPSEPSSSSGSSSDEIKVTPSVLYFPSTGGEKDVTIQSTSGWRAQAQQDWILMAHEKGTKIVTVIVSAGDKAEGSIVFETMSGSQSTVLKIYRDGGSGGSGGGSGNIQSDGLFSVSATKKVVFSPGNLQYNPGGGGWRFAEHQYDYIGQPNENVSVAYSGWIDLFGWGTSGWNSGAVAYQPWATNYSSQDYFPGGTPNNEGLTGTYANADWGRNMGGVSGQSGIWRTLTQTEWNYLLDTRAPKNNYEGNGNLLSCYGNINGINGFFLFPDDYFTISNQVQYSPLMVDFTTNSFSLKEWKEMEKQGVVFLPCAGYRMTESNYDFDTKTSTETVHVYRVGYRGVYWSATSFEGWPDPAMVEFAVDNDLRIGNFCSPSYGLSVRLVQDVK